ncbi:MAG TPA: polysaccharide biosynthesis protein, partial [Aliiroseovarius sp.]|nr:polysaccharide biosynthesis protein [Aliiroseovarius sp.]
ISGLYVLSFLTERSLHREPVAIYGAGSAGIQLALALRQSSEVCPKFFVDDNPQLKGLMIAGLPVFAPEKLEKCVSSYQIKHVLIAMPSVSQIRRDELVKSLSHLPVEVRILPSYIDMIENKGLLTSFRTVSPDELLGRNKVDLDIPEIAKTYIGRVIMVTGAGGSIGSELCRQILECKPARIILFERSEFNLYSIDRELRDLAKKFGISVVSRLGSVTDKARVSAVIAEENVEIILHAAAYKHVPLVEENKLEGARNNVLGTQIVALCAAEAEIERFILISTDKAVRPTNVMGATKRMAELVVQDIQTRHQKTKFAMVRFGNVLGSSGSVLPLFQKQIQAGGPVTVTHANVTRFFMTIPEASRLVLLAGAYAKGGDVFVLDMGEPLKIIDVARQMIELSGRTVKDPLTGVGDIAIIVTGLRPGEKLYEELLLDDDSLRPTPHAKILRAEEAMLSQIEVASMLRELNRALSENDPDRLFRLIQERVEGFHRQAMEDDSLSV